MIYSPSKSADRHFMLKWWVLSVQVTTRWLVWPLQWLLLSRKLWKTDEILHFCVKLAYKHMACFSKSTICGNLIQFFDIQINRHIILGFSQFGTELYIIGYINSVVLPDWVIIPLVSLKNPSFQPAFITNAKFELMTIRLK